MVVVVVVVVEVEVELAENMLLRKMPCIRQALDGQLEHNMKANVRHQQLREYRLLVEYPTKKSHKSHAEIWKDSYVVSMKNLYILRNDPWTSQDES